MYARQNEALVEGQRTIPLFNEQQMLTLTSLVGDALTSKKLRFRLLNADSSLQAEYSLDDMTWQYLKDCMPTDLKSLCQRLMTTQGRA